MSPSPSADINLICQAILDYLLEHPEAADSPEGIAAWWLPGLARTLPVEAIRNALDRLVYEKRISRITLADGRNLYQSVDKVSGSRPAWRPDQRMS